MLKKSDDDSSETLGATPPQELAKEVCDTDLAPLFDLLTRQPANGHDCRTCPVCQRYGITEI